MSSLICKASLEISTSDTRERAIIAQIGWMKVEVEIALLMAERPVRIDALLMDRKKRYVFLKKEASETSQMHPCALPSYARELNRMWT